MKRAEVREVCPLFVDLAGAARFCGLAKKTLSNGISAGTIKVRVKYWGSKPLVEVASLRQLLDSLPSEPAAKRGRKRVGEGVVNAESTLAEKKEKPPGGRPRASWRTKQAI